MVNERLADVSGNAEERMRRSRFPGAPLGASSRPARIVAGALVLVLLAVLFVLATRDPGPSFAPLPWSVATVSGDELVVRWVSEDACERPVATRIEFEDRPAGPELTLFAAVERIADCTSETGGEPQRSTFPLPEGYPEEGQPSDGACKVLPYATEPGCA